MCIEKRASLYERAELTIVALMDRKSQRFYNVYSVIELCPKDQLKSGCIGDNEEKCIREKINQDYTLYIRRVFWDKAITAIQFFQSDNIRVINKNNENDVVYDYYTKNGEIFSEPDSEVGLLINWNSTMKSELFDVLPMFGETVRVYTKLNGSLEFRNILPQDKFLKVDLLVKKHLGISLMEHMEFLGSVFLCMPNPYLKDVRLELGRGCRKLLVRLLFRTGKSLKNGFFEVVDERKFGIGFCIRQKIINDKFVIDLPNEPRLLRYRIYSAKGELLEDCANYFIRKMSFTMAIEGAKRVFQINGKQTIVNMKSYEHFSVGDDDDSYDDLLRRERAERELKRLEEKRIFVYFPGDRDGRTNSKGKAVQIIRELIKRAKERCIICDPYLSGNDYLEYGIQVSSANIILTLITSEKFMLQKISKEDSKIQGDFMDDILSKVKSQIMIKCYILKGKERSPLHDRFIIVDDNAYLLGSSLAEFGSRATTLYKVPDANILYRTARKWMDDTKQCVDFDEWIEDLRRVHA
ncbi:MAG: VPA1262 family N-terminal domain-containing protein [Megasphaera cerevisiae]|jgi:hypothetical protein|nr:VPA1262 family N-terminal domain-containing protein [Megasphaera cerevisiae]